MKIHQFFSENSEKPALCLLTELGYEYIKPADLRETSSTLERLSLRNVLLKKRLTAKIKEFNPWINDYNIKQVFRMLTIPQVSEIEFNQEIWGYLTKSHTFTVEQDIEDGRGRRHQPVKLIEWDDIEKNEFIVSNQYKVNSSKGNIIPDIVVFVNGIPLVVIECKSPILQGEHIIPGIRQLDMYQNRAPKLFYYNQILIATAGLTSYYGVVGNSYSHFKQWKEPYPITESDLEEFIRKTGRRTTNPTPQDILIYGLLEPHNLLNIIRNFILFQTVNGKLIKMMARYQQYRATNKTIERILKPKERGGTINPKNVAVRYLIFSSEMLLSFRRSFKSTSTSFKLFFKSKNLSGTSIRKKKERIPKNGR
ncbi:MAG: type I restriction endonuclease [Promethearchaeota archaeon]